MNDQNDTNDVNNSNDANNANGENDMNEAINMVSGLFGNNNAMKNFVENIARQIQHKFDENPDSNELLTSMLNGNSDSMSNFVSQIMNDMDNDTLNNIEEAARSFNLDELYQQVQLPNNEDRIHINFDRPVREIRFNADLSNNSMHNIIQPIQPIKPYQIEKKVKVPLYDDLKHDVKSTANDICNVCVICLENARNCIILPCAHMILCVRCSIQHADGKNRGEATCPSCREPIKIIKRVYE